MIIGLPKALLYYRYSHLWETFFRELGCEVVVSGETNRAFLAAGMKKTVDENCLPLKAFMGHVQSLIGRCDYILVPRFTKTGRDEEYCVRFWGLPDLVQNTFREVSLLSYSLDSGWSGAERIAFIKMGRTLGKGVAQSLQAYSAGLEAQRLHDHQQILDQHALFQQPNLKILIAAQPYLIHDPYVGGTIRKIIIRQGGVPLFSDRCSRSQCRALSKIVSSDLYWTLNKEMTGAVMLYKNRVDGIMLLTAFPCGSDSLVNELVMRKVKEVPLIQILLDEHQAEAGLETRIESFMDILQQRRAYAENA